MTPEIVAAIVNSFSLVVPEMMLGLAGCIAFVGGTIRANRGLWASYSLISLAVACLSIWLLAPSALTSENLEASHRSRD